MLDRVIGFVSSGGWAMWPLLGLSLISLTLSFERSWYWLKENSPKRIDRARLASHFIRKKDFSAASDLVKEGKGLYANVISQLVLEKDFQSQASGIDAIENQRTKMERFMATLSTIITAAPMIGILGTVTGIIQSFNLIGQGKTTVTDPTLVSHGIAEALITTGAGLVVAIITLFPYNMFKTQVDRTLGRLEAIVASTEKPSEMS